jgi:carboxymethylenebutenolidase
MKKLGVLSLLVFFIACTQKEKNTDKGMSVFTSDKNFAKAHEIPKALNYQAKGKMIKFSTPDGKEGMGYSVTKENAKATLILVHEWWGLNDYVKREADRYFDALGNINVLAIDMYDGHVATTPEDATKYMKGVTDDRAEAIIKGAINLHTAKLPVATIGWCFGGGWSLKASLLAAEQSKACVMFYGMPVMEADKLAKLKAPVLGLFGDKDQWITPEVVQKFTDVMTATGKSIKTKEFGADHGFANPSSPKYNEPAAQEANKMAMEFLKDKLGKL